MELFHGVILLPLHDLSRWHKRKRPVKLFCPAPGYAPARLHRLSFSFSSRSAALAASPPPAPDLTGDEALRAGARLALGDGVGLYESCGAGGARRRLVTGPL
jgi:hypothetical protein